MADPRRWCTASLIALLFAPPLLAAAPAQEQPPVQTRTVNDGQLILQDVPELSAELAASLNRYQNVRSASFADWTGDSRSMYVLTRFGQVQQLHRVDMPGGARHQLTFTDEPVRNVSRQPGGDLLVFSMDAGGNEFSQVYLMDPATGSYRMLTDGRSRNTTVRWSEDGQRIAWQSTRRNGRSNDVWIMQVADPASARVALESPDGSLWGPVEFSPDGGSLLVQQYVSVTDSRIHLLDLDSGESQRVLGSSERPAANRAGGFDHAGKGLFYITDRDAEFSRLAYRTLEPGATEQIVTGDISWDVNGFQLSPDGTRAAFTVNEDGFGQLYLLDPGSLRYRKAPDMPAGLVSSIEFSPDSRRLAVVLNSPQTPSDSYVLDLGEGPLDSGKLVRWTYSEVGGLDTSRFAVPELIRYPTFDRDGDRPREVPAFVYRPQGEGPFPVIISIHGGPESQYRPSFRTSVQQWIDLLGAAVIAPNVRGSRGYGRSYVSLDNGILREDSVRDIGALLDWIQTQDDLDADRVAVIGGSYGGYMVLASAVHYSDRLKAAVDVVGISSFVTFLENTQDYRRDLRRAEYGDERIPEMREHLEKISPLNNVEKIKVPLMVVQGQNDPRVPVSEAEQIVKAVRSQGHEVWYINALNEGHGFRRKENREVYGQARIEFFRRYLLPTSPE